MQISDIKANHIKPFEIDDVNLIRLFSFFLHSAPTVDSATASVIAPERLEQNWEQFISELPKSNYVFLAPKCSIEQYMEKYNLHNNASVNRRSKGFVCKRKESSENDYECVLRHIRNAIAHSNVYMSNAGNRKYLLFEDFNKSKKQSSIMLFYQADLTRLKKEIMR